MAAAITLTLSLLFLGGNALLWKRMGHSPLRSLLEDRWTLIVTLIIMTILTAIEGTWGLPIHKNPVFWAVTLVMMANLEFTVLNDIRGWAGLASIFSHAGFFILCFGAFWGAPSFVEAQMPVPYEASHDVAFTRDHKLVKLPFSVSLKDFSIERYADGISPKQYTSTLDLSGKEFKTKVNNPCYHKGYYIYQADYDHIDNSYTILKLVKDPWLPVVYLGIFLLAAGAFMGLRKTWKSRWLTVIIILTAILFTFLSIKRISFGTLVPALRSWWFVPHLGMYMTAYSLLAIASVLSVISGFGAGGGKLEGLSTKLFSTSSSLLLLGMICGALWAKAAWGDWWSWDAKECWAAVTWLTSLIGIHLPKGDRKRQIAVVVTILLSFAAMQMAWYGVEHVPAARASMHSYK